MFGSGILDAAVGLSFIYLLLALICSVLNEWLATIINKRGKNLFEGIKNLLNDPDFNKLAQQLYTHGLIDCISKEAANPDASNRLPSYIPSSNFSLALIDILRSKGLRDGWAAEVAQRRLALNRVQAGAAAVPPAATEQEVAAAQHAFNEAMQAFNTAQAVADAHHAAASAAKGVDGPQDLDNLQAASSALQRALAMGRDIAARFPDPLRNVECAAQALPAGHTRETLLVLIDKTRSDARLLSAGLQTADYQLDRFRVNVEQWFDDAMERVGGWYKRWTQVVQLVLAALVVALTNADTIAIADRLTHDSDLRGALVSAAIEAAKSAQANPADGGGPDTPPAAAQEKLLEQAEKLSLPLGWACAKTGLRSCVHRPGEQGTSAKDATDGPSMLWTGLKELALWLLKLVGLLISVLAISLGAPFWFDTLSKFVNVRGAGTPPGETKKSAGRPRAA